MGFSVQDADTLELEFVQHVFRLSGQGEPLAGDGPAILDAGHADVAL